jgi:CheY-like chemotaxis protein
VIFGHCERFTFDRLSCAVTSNGIHSNSATVQLPSNAATSHRTDPRIGRPHAFRPFWQIFCFTNLMEATMDPKRILVAEDDASIRQLVATLLRRSGNEVTMAANGEEALEALANQTFDVVVLDLMMPSTDGFDVLRVIETNHTSTCVIVLTAAGPLLIGGRDLSRANFVLSKPFDLDQLVHLAATCTNPQPQPEKPSEETAA